MSPTARTGAKLCHNGKNRTTVRASVRACARGGEAHTCTRFGEAFTHISERNARVEDLAISIRAVLIAEACNIGLEPLVRPDAPALTRRRLLWVQHDYVRAETIALANALLVEAQSKIAWRRPGAVVK